MQERSLPKLLREVANLYPNDLIRREVQDIPRITFNINIALDAIKPRPLAELELCDLGGGIGLYSVGCAAFGMKRVVLVDDFDDSVNHQVGESILDIHRSYGVQVIEGDVVAGGIEDIPGTFDIITTFDSMEHWHHSPKGLFRGVLEKLKPGGVFVLGVPNCVNLRKRITVPFGKGKWSSMKEWYELDLFRGHVREPDIDDLHYIANDMGLSNITIYGRNWLGYYSANAVTRLVTKIMDYPIRLNPSLCSDIYMVGKKV